MSEYNFLWCAAGLLVLLLGFLVLSEPNPDPLPIADPDPDPGPNPSPGKEILCIFMIL